MASLGQLTMTTFTESQKPLRSTPMGGYDITGVLPDRRTAARQPSIVPPAPIDSAGPGLLPNRIYRRVESKGQTFP